MNEIVQHAEAQAPAVSHPLPVAGEGNLLAAIMVLARDPSMDAVKLRDLMEMQERMEARQAERAFNEALVRVTTGMPRVKKNGTIDLGKGKPIPFAKWEDVDAVIRPRMEAHGFTLSFDTESRAGEGGGAWIVGTLLHAGGHKRSARIPLPLDNGPGRNNLQAMGSTVSYGKRYCAEMLLNIVREGQDTDGRGFGKSDETITDEEKAELVALLQQLPPAATTEFLSSAGIPSLDDLPANRFTAAKNGIQKRIVREKGDRR